jgi:hypothetical protein
VVAAGAPSRRPSFNAAMGDKIIVDLEAKAEVDSKDVDPEVRYELSLLLLNADATVFAA